MKYFIAPSVTFSWPTGNRVLRSRSAACLVMFLFVLPTLSSFADDDQKQKPNILFLAIDDLRPALGCYDDANAITPNIDRLAAKGLQFDRAYCQVAVCNPCRASLMTGLRPDNLGVWTLPIHFREAKPDAVTLPQWLRKSGYTAVGHGKIFHNPTPDPQSWSEPVEKRPSLDYPYPDGTRDKIKAANESLPSDDWRKNKMRGPATAAPECEDNELLDGFRTDVAISDLRRLGKTKEPFFLAMGYVRPHLAWIAPKKYWDMHDVEKFPVLTDQVVNPNTPPYAMFSNSEMRHYVDLIDFPDPWDEERAPASQVKHLLHSYYACVSYVDTQVGRVLDALEEEGLADNTIIVLWSDHGWKLGEYGAWGKRTNYEIDTRVPMIISIPGMQNAGKRTMQVVELLDLYPTLCDLAGIDAPSFVDGKSLRPVIEDVEKPIHAGAISQYYRKKDDDEVMGYAIRTTTHRFVEWRDFKTGEVASTELYDHSQDADELKNIADSAPSELIDQLTEQLLKTHPRKGLVMKPVKHSQAGNDRAEVGITFSNESNSIAMVNLIRSNGRRAWKFKAIKRIAPGEKLTIKNARVGNVYSVEAEDGKLQEYHTVPDTLRTVVLKN